MPSQDGLFNGAMDFMHTPGLPKQRRRCERSLAGVVTLTAHFSSVKQLIQQALYLTEFPADVEGNSFRAIVADLEAQGISTRNGGSAWHALHVRSVLRSKIALA